MRQFDEPAVILRPMKASGEVVEDYVHLGLHLAHIRSVFCAGIYVRKRL